jgi:hypothetical protein
MKGTPANLFFDGFDGRLPFNRSSISRQRLGAVIGECCPRMREIGRLCQRAFSAHVIVQPNAYVGDRIEGFGDVNAETAYREHRTRTPNR